MGFAVYVLWREIYKGCAQNRVRNVSLFSFFFQFLTFSERLSNINIDIIHRIDRTGSYAEVKAEIMIVFRNHITSRYTPQESLKKSIWEEIGKKLLQELLFLEPHFMLCSLLLFNLVCRGTLTVPP